MKKGLFRKGLVLGIIFLLIGISIISIPRNVVENATAYYSPLESIDNPINLLACDHLAYIGGAAFETDWLYEFNLDDPFNLTLVCSDYGPDFPSDSAAWTNEGKIIFVSAGMYPWLGSIDSETCDWYWIMGGGVNCDGLAWNSVNNRLFGTSGMYLYEFDPETGEQIEIGPHSQPADIILCAIACDSDGIMYGWEWLNRRLCTIDIDTGEATVIGELNIAPYFALDGAFCLEDDILYIFAYGTDPNCLYLYECDEDTGSCTLIDQNEEIDLVSPDLFVIPWNYPPNASSNPIPPNGATDVDIEVVLSWTCSDPDGDTIVYDVYLDIVSPPEEKVSDDRTETTFDPGILEFATTYYWQIIASDEHNTPTAGPVWHFTTEDNSPPDAPTIDGPVSGQEGKTYTYTFTSSDPNSDDIANYTVNWGNGPLEILEGPFTSGSSAKATHKWPSQRTYTIMAKAKDKWGAESDWAEFEVSIPRTRASSYLWFLERFPMLERLLSLLL